MKKIILSGTVCAVCLATSVIAAPLTDTQMRSLVEIMNRNGDAATLAKVKTMSNNPAEPIVLTAPDGKKFVFSLLTIAVFNNCRETAVYLLERGADVNAVTVRPDGVEETPLSAVFAEKWRRKVDYAMARLLIDRGADVNVTVARKYRNELFRESVLALAMNAGVRERKYDVPFLNLLLDKGADPAAKTCLRSGDAKQPQSLYCLTGNQAAEIAFRLVQAGVEGTPSKSVRKFIAEKPDRKKLDSRLARSYSFDLDVALGDIAALIAAGADPNQPYMMGEFAKAGNYPVLEYLRRHGADLKRYGGEAACWASNESVIRYLHKQGVPLDTVIVTDGGRGCKTPLSSAVSCGKIEVIRYLLENGVSANSPEVIESAMWIIRFGFGIKPEQRRKTVRLLLDHGLRFSAEQLKKLRQDPKVAAFAKELGIAL